MNRLWLVALVLVQGVAWHVDAAARGCADFGGLWDASLSGRVRCSAQGQSVEQPFAGFGTVTIRQRGCRFRFVPPDNDVTGADPLRGTIRGRNITLREPAVPSIPDLEVEDFDFTGRGHIRRGGDRAIIRISARLAGESEGVNVICRVRATTRFARLAAVTGGSNGPARAPTGGVPALMDAAGLAALAVRTGLPDRDWRIVGAGDLDGDGRTDFVWNRAGTGLHQIWLNDPAEPQGIDRGPDWSVDEVRDLDGDGRADLLWRHAPDGLREAWLMDGAAARERMNVPPPDGGSGSVR
jgi:hypothetical protein